MDISGIGCHRIRKKLPVAGSGGGNVDTVVVHIVFCISDSHFICPLRKKY
jgi:hypothetical protein